MARLCTSRALADSKGVGSADRSTFTHHLPAAFRKAAQPKESLRCRSTPLQVSGFFGKKEPKDKLCKDMVSAPTKKREDKEYGTCTVSFVGAGEKEIQVEMSEGEYILDQAEAAGIDLPATCRGGICGACVGRVVQGSVDQSDIDDLDFVLEPEHQEMGMAILCMSRPVGDCKIEAQCDWGNISMSEWKGATWYEGEPVKLDS